MAHQFPWSWSWLSKAFWCFGWPNQCKTEHLLHPLQQPCTHSDASGRSDSCTYTLCRFCPCRTVSFHILQARSSTLLLWTWSSSSCSFPAPAKVVLKFNVVQVLFWLTYTSATSLCCRSLMLLASSASLDTSLFCSLICCLICSSCLAISSAFDSVKMCVSWSLSFNFLSLNPTMNLSHTCSSTSLYWQWMMSNLRLL